MMNNEIKNALKQGILNNRRALDRRLSNLESLVFNESVDDDYLREEFLEVEELKKEFAVSLTSITLEDWEELLKN